jgi:hypothetical protein
MQIHQFFTSQILVGLQGRSAEENELGLMGATKEYMWTRVPRHQT